MAVGGGRPGRAARDLFGGAPGKGLFRGSRNGPHRYADGKGLMAKIKPGPNGRWLEWQEKPGQLFAMGSLFGILAGGASIFLASQIGTSLNARGRDPSAAVNNAQTFTFGISAIIILFLITNRNMPVQHHVTITAGLAALKFFPIFGGEFVMKTDTQGWIAANVGPSIGALAAALLAGLLAAFLCELFARLWYNRGTSHIDPPAASIWICNTAVVSLALLF